MGWEKRENGAINSLLTVHSESLVESGHEKGWFWQRDGEGWTDRSGGGRSRLGGRSAPTDSVDSSSWRLANEGEPRLMLTRLVVSVDLFGAS
jgi:hypothetical protein